MESSAALSEVEKVIRVLQIEGDVLDQNVRWYPERWRVSGLERFHNAVELFSKKCVRDDNNYQISRRNVIEVSRNVDDVFIGAMIFGYGDRGYGPSRVKRVLQENKKIFERNLQVQYEASKNGPEASWMSHTKIAKLKFFGPAFATKFAYFGARYQKVESLVPLIADRNTSWGSWKLVKIPRSVERLDGYLRYVKLAHDWGKSHGKFGADEVERAIFEIGKDYVPKKRFRSA